MSYVADLHLHSRYARACSKNLNFDTLSHWGKLKGLQLLSSADFTHPEWFKETKENLKELGNGLYEYNEMKFVIGGEISCIYSQGGKVRRVHLLILLPSLDSAAKVNEILGKRGKLASDGRPILGISAHDLAEIVLGVEPRAILIPAHIWTPWFSLYGSNSGFDSIDDCFGELSPYIYAVETGLSSDPKMNWRIPELDNRSIVSFSDAHSPAKMSREVTIFNGDLSYEGLLNSLKNQNIDKTIEFFPEEGKYHFTGHRSCNVKHSPSQTKELGTICPQCSRKLTVGVMHRVEELSKREEVDQAEGRPPYKNLVPLLEVVAEAVGTSTNSQKVKDEYLKIVKYFENEFNALLYSPIEDLLKITTSRVAEGVDKVRRGDIIIDPGYDGLFGIVKIWPETVKKHPPLPVVKKKIIDDGQIALL